MFSYKLFWRVTFNFAFLLIILTVTTFLTINNLNKIQKNYSQASLDLTTTMRLDRIKQILSDIETASNEYMYTGMHEKRNAYDENWKDFDLEFAALQKVYTDSIEQQTLDQIRTSFYNWISNIGDKKILIRSLDLTPEKAGLEIQALGRQETNSHYLETAKGLLNSLYKRRLSSVPVNIDIAIGLTRNIATFIMMVNIMLAVFAVALGWYLTKSITKPVEQLRDGTQKIMKGIFEPINLKRRDELGALASDFNHMSKMLQQNYKRLTAYSELMTALNKHDSLENVEEKSLQILCMHTNVSIGALYIMENSSGKLKLASGYALNSKKEILEYKIGEGIPGQCAAMKQNIEINNTGVTKDFIIATGIVDIVPAYIMATPILFQDNLTGVIIFGSMQPFEDFQREIIMNSVPQIGVAITNAFNFESTRKLSNEVAEKNSELNSKNAELQKAYRVKSDFLSNMSHELRTPLNSIIGFTSVLLGPHGDPLTQEQAKALEKVLKNGRHLLELINDILDFSKIEAGRTPINIETDEVENIIANAMVTVEPMVLAKGVKLVQNIEPGLPKLNTDILKVKQILLNLLSNAAKFTDQGAITITAHKQNEMINIAVKDDGIGIEKKNLEKVFEEFSQIDSSNSRKYKGTGLGLPIAKNYARLLGGSLTVESEFGKGSIFTLKIPPEFPKDKLNKISIETQTVKKPAIISQDILPAVKDESLQKVEFQQKMQTLESTPTSSSVLILCIDDDQEVIDLLRRYLIPEGYSVQSALSGDSGIELARKLQPSVITLDIMMPGKDGWQVLRELKSDPKTRDIPVIIHSIVDNKPLALSLGALDVIAKPSELKRVLSVVERACRTKNQTILIVDDNEDFAESLKIMLQVEGYKAITMYSGEQVLKEIGNINPSLLFLDLIMPGIDGFGVVHQLRSKEQWRNLPIVILSGAEVEQEKRDNLNKHIQDFIEKGHFSKEVISNTIKKIIQQKNT